MAKDFEVIVIDPPDRVEAFRKIFGRNSVCVQSPIPSMVRLPGGAEALAYLLDLDMITDEQEDRLVAHLARTNNQKEKDVRDDLRNDGGLPILAEGTAIVVHNPLRWVD